MDWRDPSHLYAERSRYRGPGHDDERVYRRSTQERLDQSRSRLRTFEQLRARELMWRQVISVQPEDSVARAARLMAECDCGALPVVDREDHLIGMITDRDIAVRVAARGWDCRRAQVGDAMTHDAFACRTDDRLLECMREMSRHQVRRIPIVDRFDRVVGILSQGDLARHAGMVHEPAERDAFSEALCAISEPTHVSHR